MLEKFSEAVWTYCFAIMELFDTFLERTHAVVGLGLPLLVMVGIGMFLPNWVQACVWLFVLGPAVAATITMIIHSLLLTRGR
jgi:predicted tellurium resistance membrane protein TerC